MWGHFKTKSASCREVKKSLGDDILATFQRRLGRAGTEEPFFVILRCHVWNSEGEEHVFCFFLLPSSLVG